MTRFSEEWWDAKQRNVAAWKAMEAARSAQTRAGKTEIRWPHKPEIPGSTPGLATPQRPLPSTDRADAGATTPAIPSGVGGTRAPIDCSRGPATAPATVRARPKADAANGRQTIGVADAASRAPIYPLVGLCRAAGLPEPVPEYRWHPVRKFRADYALPLHRVLIEIDGGLFINGGHSRGAARMHDMAKDRAATLLGWRTLRYAPTELTAIISDLRILLAGDAT